MVFQSINPTTEQWLASHEVLDESGAMVRLEKAQRVFLDWKNLSVVKRLPYFQKLADILFENKEATAWQMALEMGKPISQGRNEVSKCISACQYFIQNAEKFLASEGVETEALRSFVAFEPLGVVLGVMPWNFPFWQVLRFAIPTLIAGNTVILKHAPNVQLCAKLLDSFFLKAGFPNGLFQNLTIEVDVLETLVAHPFLKGVALTGSTLAGQTIGQLAGKYLKKTVLELGGSDPLIVLEDADLEMASSIAIQSRFSNAGQSCIAAKRVIVVEAVRDVFEEKLLEKIKKIKVGDPLEETTEMGPLARVDLRENLHRQVRVSVEQGARCLVGGQLSAEAGYFYPPTLLTQVRSEMPVYREEVFGPVAVIVSVPDEKSAIQVANDTSFGLGASLFTKNLAKAELLASQIEAGQCFINGLVRSDLRLPFGGIKNSGLGRELSKFGIREFVNLKTVWIES